MYPEGYDDGGTCHGCGCDMEVIGPPGPRHLDGCPEKEPSGPPECNLTDDEADYLFEHTLGTDLGMRMRGMSHDESRRVVDDLLRRRTRPYPSTLDDMQVGQRFEMLNYRGAYMRVSLPDEYRLSTRDGDGHHLPVVGADGRVFMMSKIKPVRGVP
jgi:hypothetical protein